MESLHSGHWTNAEEVPGTIASNLMTSQCNPMDRNFSNEEQDQINTKRKGLLTFFKKNGGPRKKQPLARTFYQQKEAAFTSSQIGESQYLGRRSSNNNVRLKVDAHKSSFNNATEIMRKTSSQYEGRASDLNSIIQKALDRNYEEVEEDVSMKSADIGFGLGPRAAPETDQISEAVSNDDTIKGRPKEARHSSTSKSRDLTAVMQKIRRQTRFVNSSEVQSSVPRVASPEAQQLPL